MMRGINLLFVISVNFNFIVSCFSHVSYPVTVSINKARSSLDDSYDVQIAGGCKTWKLRLAPLKNKCTCSLNDEAPNLRSSTNDIIVYRDAKIGSVLSIKGNEVNGLLNRDYSIISRNEKQFLIKFKRSETDDDQNDVFNPNILSTIDGLNKQAKPSFKNSPEWPVPLFFVDAFVDDGLAKIIGNNSQIADYLTTFWTIVIEYYNKMDLFYYIRLNICSINKYKNDSSFKVDMPFIANIPDSEGYALIDGLSAWAAANYEEPYLQDIVFLHINKDLMGHGISAPMGIAVKYGGICTSINNCVAIGEDIGAMFAGTRTAAHEVAHVFGSLHDTTVPGCLFNDGYLMGKRIINDSRGALPPFSNCSFQIMKETIFNQYGLCRDKRRPFIG